jgi:omega-6 fatty acid desaturase (delta-12 desaturase)
MLGFVLGVLTLTPYAYWRKTHAIHHATSGNLDHRGFGDVTTLTVKEYLALTRWRRLRYRLYRSPLVLFGLGPVYEFILRHRFPVPLSRSWRREWASVFWTNLAILAVVAMMWKTIGIQAFLAVQLPITLLAGSAGVWLFYIQHQFEDTYWEKDDAWDFHEAGLEGSSYYDLPGILHWFTGNIGVHHVHHLSSRIPNYRLRQCLRENPELQQVTRLTLWGSLKCARLKLWDEERRRLVDFRHLGSIRAKS